VFGIDYYPFICVDSL